MDPHMNHLRSSLAQVGDDGGPRNQSKAAETFCASCSDAGQLMELAKQLHVQTDYNNDLLQQIQRLEEGQLAAQRLASEKQAALRQAMTIAESARAEANDLKRKLAVSQEVSNKLSEEAKEARVEVGILRRQQEALEKLASEARTDIATLREERSQLIAALEASNRDARNAHRSLSELQTESSDKYTLLSAQSVTLTRELAELRARQGPLAAEVETSRASIAKLSEEVEEARRGRADALLRLERERQAVEAAEQLQREARASEARALRVAEDSDARCAAVRSELARHAELMAQREGEVAGLTARLGDAASEISRGREEAAWLRSECERNASELAAGARARAADAEAFELRLREATEDVRRVGEEARAREGAHVSELARRSEEVTSARRRGEELAARLQGDLDALHLLLAEAQAGAKAQGARFEEERGGYERRLQEAAMRGTVASEVLQREAADLRAANAALSAQITALRDEASARAERHTGMLAALQATLRAIKDEAATCKEDYARLAAGVKELHSRIADAGAAAQAPMNGWYEETKRSLLVLSDSAGASRRQAEELKDQVATQSVALEEARARALMAEELLSRAEHDASSTHRRLLELEADSNARKAAAEETARAQARTMDELSGELSRLRTALDKANKQSLLLQSDLARAQGDTAETQSRSGARVSALEEQLFALQSTTRSLSAQLDSAAEERARLQAQTESAVSTAERFARERANIMEKMDEHSVQCRAAQQQHAAQIKQLAESKRSLEAQAKQTQSLLQVVQEQRRQLQESNAQLRSELDERYAASLGLDGPGSKVFAPQPA